MVAAAVLAVPPAWARALGSVDFTPCELDGRNGARVHAECARMEVPENPRDAVGRKILLQLALLPSRAPRPESDVVVLLAGGPGQSALDSYADVAAAFEPLRRQRHVLLVDQRGTGRSNPLKCPVPDWRDESEETPAVAREQTRRCLALLAPHADLRLYTTSEAVADLETVRAAIGAPALDLVGVSYGTRVGLEYLRRHPRAVRTLVLDSPVPPELALLQDHAANLDALLARLFAACRADAACVARFGDPGQTLQRLRAQAGRAAPVLVADPNTNLPSPLRLTPGVLGTVVRLHSYQAETAAVLPLLLDEAAHGRPQPLIAQAALLFRALGDSMAHGLELSVVCAEDAPFLQPPSAADRGSLLGAGLHELLKAECGAWPRGSMPEDFKQPVRSDAPVLVLSGERDPVTPPRYGTRILTTLPRGRQLVLAGQGHAVMIRGCAPRLIRRFVEAADAAALDASCLDRLQPLPFFTAFSGSEP